MRSTAGGTPSRIREAPNLSGVWKSNINSLIPHRAIGRIGFGAPFKNVMCKIYKVDGLDALGTLDPDTEEGAIGKDKSSYVAADGPFTYATGGNF